MAGCSCVSSYIVLLRDGMLPLQRDTLVRYGFEPSHMGVVRKSPTGPRALHFSGSVWLILAWPVSAASHHDRHVRRSMLLRLLLLLPLHLCFHVHACGLLADRRKS